MRYDKPVYFQKVVSGEYDISTGNYGKDMIEETLRYASVMDTGSEMMRLLYGGIRQGSLTIQIQNHYRDSFDRIRVGKISYGADFSRKLRSKQTFVVSEVQEWQESR